MAEIYREWAAARDAAGPVARAFGKVRAFLGAVANALRGRGFQSAALTMERIAGGVVGGRGPDGPGGSDGAAGNEMRAALARLRTQPNGERGVVSQILTDAMGGKGPTNLLALVPGEPLLAELGKTVPSLQAYRDLKHAMATERNERQAKADEVAQRWRKLMRGKS